jgi:hypothetical protein
MTKIRLKWKPVKDESPVYLEEAAQLLGTTYEALRARVHRMKNEGQADTLPDAFKDTSGGRERWAFNRGEFMAFIKTKAKLDAIVQGSKK